MKRRLAEAGQIGRNEPRDVGLRLGIPYILLLIAAIQIIPLGTLVVTRIGILVFQSLYFCEGRLSQYS